MHDVSATYRLFSEDRKDEFFSKGYARRYFFPHKTYYIPNCGVDGLMLAESMWNNSDPNLLWELVLFASESEIQEFPPDLFFDKDVIWHQRHMGKTGQIGSANLIVEGDKLYTIEHMSDLVQRIYLRREYRTRINSRFKYWHHMLLNSVLNFAVEMNLSSIWTPTADMIVEKYVNRKVNRRMFDRIYDQDIKSHFDTSKDNGWWVIDVDRHRHKLIKPERKWEIDRNDRKTICIYHDIERGFGHTASDPEFASRADKNFEQTINRILAVERERNVKTTYNVVGMILDEVKERIQRDSHCLAFHSYNHQESRRVPGELSDHATSRNRSTKNYVLEMSRRCLRKLPAVHFALSKLYHKVSTMLGTKANPVEQLKNCRVIDYRLKGYHPCQLDVVAEACDLDLCFYNFEWLAVDNDESNVVPYLQNRIVKIPVFCDDYHMHHSGLSYETWEHNVIQRIKQVDFLAVGLHDCYADHWLPHYPKFLENLTALGELKTLDEIANRVFLTNSV